MKTANRKVCRECVCKRFDYSKKRLDDLERYIFANHKWKICKNCKYEMEHMILNG